MSTLLFDTSALIELCRENGVAKLGVFGSMAMNLWDATRCGLLPRLTIICRCCMLLAPSRTGDAVTFPVEGFDGGSISMLTLQPG